MIVEKTDVLCNGRIIKYLSAHSFNGNTIYRQESKNRLTGREKELAHRRKTRVQQIPIHSNFGYGVLGESTWGKTREYPENPEI